MRIGDLLWKREFCFHRDAIEDIVLCRFMQFEMDKHLRMS